MRTNDELKAWREAASTGGLPQPGRERWQPLRAGVVNLWEFEAAEYWYAGGWAQLMGRNETGKSSLMALTTLIPWLADTSSDKIDTLGRSGKQFSYYVRPTGTDGDRRDASGSHFHGWLWVEYGRVTDDGPQFFTTLLYASARGATPRVNLEWCTAEGSRVREALRLAIGREILSPKNIDAPGFTQHGSAQAYKADVADRLLASTVDRLEIVGKILKVTRTPKLGAQLDVRFVTDHLRSSLPELRRSEIEQLAQGWDQLDQIRHDLKRTQDAADIVAKFTSDAWQPWLQAKLRIAADEAADRRTKFDRVRRDEDAAQEVLREAEATNAELHRRSDEAQLRSESAAAAADELRTSAAFKEAQGRIQELHRAEEAVTSAEQVRQRAAKDLQRATEARATTAADHEEQQRAVAEQEQRTGEAQDYTRRDAGLAGLPTPEAELDADRLRQRITERRRAVDQAAKLVRANTEANTQATQAEETAATLQGVAEGAVADAEAAWLEAQAQRESLIDAVTTWTRDLAAAPDHRPWVDGLPRAVTDLDAPTLKDAIREDWYEPRRTTLDDERRLAEAAEEAARDRADHLRVEIASLEGAGIVPPAEPVLWRRRSRDGVDGSPLWQLLNPVPALPDDHLAHIEAALAASGLLDAWVSPEGLVGLDTFAVAPGAVVGGQNLGSALTVAESAGPLAAVAQAVLDGVALLGDGTPLPDGGLAVATDGRWRSSALTGTAAPAHEAAEWLGEAAREAQRRRRLEALTTQLQADEAVAAQQHSLAVAARASLGSLTDAFGRAPSDTQLRQGIHTAVDREQQADARSTQAATAAQTARTARATADSRRAELLRFTNDAALPHTADALDEVREALHAVVRRLDQLRYAREALYDARAVAHRTGAQLATRQREYEDLVDADRQAERDLTVSRARAAAVRAMSGADDAAILDRLEELRMEAGQAAALHKQLENQRSDLRERLGAARTKLESTQSEREVVTRERDEAFRQFRSLVDRGFLLELDLQLPEPASSTIENVRAQVAEVRRAIGPRRWQEGDARANAEVLQRLRSTLENSSRDVNSELEQGGRSLKLEPVDDLIRIDVTVDTNGRTLPLREAVEDLAVTVSTLQRAYDARVQATLDELLGSAFLEHMRDRIGTAQNLIREINKVLGEHATTTSGTAMRIRLNPDQNRAVLDAVSGAALQDPHVQEQVRGFLRDRVDEAKRLAADRGQADWHDALAQQLDYRDWYEVTLERRIGSGGSWNPLTTRSFAEMSGGARAVMLMLPLVATLAALYRDMPGAPRPIWLDEAFDGLDVANRSMVMDLLRQFDLDVLLAGPGRLVNVEVVPAAAIYQVVRAPAPLPGADLTLELWAGGSLDLIDLPLSWLDVAPTEPAPGQDSLL
ncbi:SbcC/MukB-like Walker B domain-containing protein [Aestuariimicrobium sp. Y1814]|uniref:SbcC/MukB-like Walker B domain-containing protein n=1 Tax=Aestuariimicrobium sp. Y1814 TaxID=3418742 RepID=UPI003DA7A080